MIKYNFFPSDADKLLNEIPKETLLKWLEEMLLIRNFEQRAEVAYLQGNVGGFFHSYQGQEAIQTAAVNVMGKEQWWSTTYRCHALALLLGATPNEVMAELYGKATGNAKGRGGSMHLYTERFLGGFGIVGGHLPVAAGAAFTMKYLGQKGVSVCFLGDGAVPQGTFHETLNMAVLWNLPCIFVIENNQWAMGTAVSKTNCIQPIAENKASSFGMKGYTLNGMDVLNCYAGFKAIYEEVLSNSKPVLVEVVTERFRGHSVSDPAAYRSKEELECARAKDSIFLFKNQLIKKGFLTEELFDKMNEEKLKLANDSMDFAQNSPWPEITTLEEDVYAGN